MVLRLGPTKLKLDQMVILCQISLADCGRHSEVPRTLSTKMALDVFPFILGSSMKKGDFHSSVLLIFFHLQLIYLWNVMWAYQRVDPFRYPLLFPRISRSRAPGLRRLGLGLGPSLPHQPAGEGHGLDGLGRALGEDVPERVPHGGGWGLGTGDRLMECHGRSAGKGSATTSALMSFCDTCFCN